MAWSVTNYEEGQLEKLWNEIETYWQEAKEGFFVTPQMGLGLEAVYLPNPPGKKGTTVQKMWAKRALLELVSHGWSIAKAAEGLGYQTKNSWERWKLEDEAWAAKVVAARNVKGGTWQYPDLSGMTFAEFCRLYGGFDLAKHQLEIEEALTDPMARLVQILGFPESGKSTLVSLWYVLYRIAQNPDVRIALVAKNLDKAKDMLTRVKRYLVERHLYTDTERNLVDDFNGWRPHHSSGLDWSATQIFVKHRRSGERDPTVQALGIGKQIYGSRLDLLILDDALVSDNQITETVRNRIDNWFTNEARSRAQKGQTVVNGTRLLPFDLYGQWKKSFAGLKTYRLVIIPAILDEGTEEEKSGWPEMHNLDGTFVLDESIGEEVYVPGLRDIRAELTSRDAARWKLVYQQHDIEETESIFRQDHVDRAFELGAEYMVGQVFDHEILILGVDPATTGRAASVLIAFDPSTRIRRVVDLYVNYRLGATGIRKDLFYQFWDKYRDHGVQFTVVETNFAPTLLGDESFIQRAEAAGTQIVDHKTVARGKRVGSKWDEEYGVAAMASLFGSGLMAFPSKRPDDAQKMQPLIEDMLGFPWIDVQDVLIALWVANGSAGQSRHFKIDQRDVMAHRGVPPVIQRRTGVYSSKNM